MDEEEDPNFDVDKTININSSGSQLGPSATSIMSMDEEEAPADDVEEIVNSSTNDDEILEIQRQEVPSKSLEQSNDNETSSNQVDSSASAVKSFKAISSSSFDVMEEDAPSPEPDMDVGEANINSTIVEENLVENSQASEVEKESEGVECVVENIEAKEPEMDEQQENPGTEQGDKCETDENGIRQDAAAAVVDDDNNENDDNNNDPAEEAVPDSSKNNNKDIEEEEDDDDEEADEEPTKPYEPPPRIQRQSSNSELEVLALQIPKVEDADMQCFQGASSKVDTLLLETKNIISQPLRPLLQPLQAPVHVIEDAHEADKEVFDEVRAALTKLKEKPGEYVDNDNESNDVSTENKDLVIAVDEKNLEIEHTAADQPQLKLPEQKTKLRLFVGTWNMMGRPCPAVNLTSFIPPHDFDIYVIGSQECDESIAKAVLTGSNSKPRWTAKILSTLGLGYSSLFQQTMAALHLGVFEMLNWFDSSKFRAGVVATGVGDVMGNKGGIGFGLNIGQHSFLFVTAHFAAHEPRVKQRNADYLRIERELGFVFAPKHVVKEAKKKKSRRPSKSNDENNSNKNNNSNNNSNNNNDSTIDEQVPKNAAESIDNNNNNNTTTVTSSEINDNTSLRASDLFDVTFWFGDLNYRVKGNRSVVDQCLKNDMIEVLHANEQLSHERAEGRVFNDYVEGPLKFPPSYKFDPWRDEYDTSEKARIPSWTDRILWREKNPDLGIVTQLAYASANQVKCSDHRPVFGHFEINVDFSARHHWHLLPHHNDKEKNSGESGKNDPQGSKTCSIL